MMVSQDQSHKLGQDMVVMVMLALSEFETFIHSLRIHFLFFLILLQYYLSPSTWDKRLRLNCCCCITALPIKKVLIRLLLH